MRCYTLLQGLFTSEERYILLKRFACCCTADGTTFALIRGVAAR